MIRDLSGVTDRFCDDEFESDGTMRRLYFRKLTTDKAEAYEPRLTSEAPKKRGVPFEYITII